MSNETDLDWLVRNVHKWPCGKHQPWCYVVTKIDGKRAWASNVLSSSFPYSRVDKDQWLARRAELQSKPEDWPKDANWLAQDRDGEWNFYTDDVSNPPQNHGEDNWYSDDVAVRSRRIGEVLGDWRDTLEKRPEEFKPFISIEDNQDHVLTQQQDNGWFERGELPPAGKVCLYVVSDRLSAEVEITAHAKFGLCFVEVGKSVENYVSKTAELHRFRPIRTEREELEILLRSTALSSFDDLDIIAGAIIAAGFRKEKK